MTTATTIHLDDYSTSTEITPATFAFSDATTGLTFTYNSNNANNNNKENNLPPPENYYIERYRLTSLNLYLFTPMLL